MRLSSEASDRSVSSDEPVATAFSAMAPLKHSVYRMLWFTWLIGNTCMWMNDVAAAWMMSTLTNSPIWVALVQTAAALPVFLFGLPSGALADILDRRRYYIVTQLWLAAVSCVLCVVIIAEAMTPTLLLALVFANGIGLAMRWPIFTAIVPELVPRTELAAALSLNSVAMNASRIIGPLIAGGLIASVGSIAVFVLNAAVSLVGAAFVIRWRHAHVANPIGQERFFSAIRVGIQFVTQSPDFQSVLLRVFLFFFHSTALLALLPLIARGLQGGDARTYTVLLASMGTGAVFAALLLPYLRQKLSRDFLILAGTTLQAAAMGSVTLTMSLYVAMGSMFLGGIAWIAASSALSISAQIVLPAWIRSRGMAMFLMAIMGGSALGAASWGQFATWTTVPSSLIIATISSPLAIWTAHWMFAKRGTEAEQTLSSVAVALPVRTMPDSGQVVMTVEYIIDPQRGEEFAALMYQSRRSNLRRGALTWNLLNDTANPASYQEQIVDRSWSDRLRRMHRMTVTDVTLDERKNAYHISTLPPVERCFVVQKVRVPE